MINAADYGYQQRRRRTFIFAYKNEETKYAKDITSAIKYVSEFGDEMHRGSIAKQIFTEGFFAKTFPVNTMDSKVIRIQKLPEEIGDLSAHFKFDFENADAMRDGVIYTLKTVPAYDGKQITFGTSWMKVKLMRSISSQSRSFITLIQISLTVMNRMESFLRSNARHGSI